MVKLSRKDQKIIDDFIASCEKTVSKEYLVTCILHGSATRNTRKHNDLDLLVLCTDAAAKSKLQFQFKDETYLDAYFSLIEDFVSFCKKPFSEHYGGSMGGKVQLAGDEFKFSIIMSVLHGMPIYRVTKGIEIIDQAKKDLKNHFGARYDEVVKQWESRYYKEPQKF